MRRKKTPSSRMTSLADLPDNTPCIVGVARTPMGSLNGSLSSFNAVNWIVRHKGNVGAGKHSSHNVDESI